MSQAREIRSKIKNIENTGQITSAMGLVAASKMRKTQNLMKKALPYADMIREVMGHVAASQSLGHPYLSQKNDAKRVAYLVVSTDRGLCGGLNVNLFRRLLTDVQEHQANSVEVELAIIGRKASAFLKRLDMPIVAIAEQIGDQPELSDLLGVLGALIKRYDEGELDRVFVISNKFVNTMVQKPRIQQLLPLEIDKVASSLGHWDYIYEPDEAKEILTQLVLRYIESQVYRGVVENIACEQASRMLAMRNATDNAASLVEELQLIYNKARQASITNEIAEIVAGADAIG